MNVLIYKRCDLAVGIYFHFFLRTLTPFDEVFFLRVLVFVVRTLIFAIDYLPIISNIVSVSATVC